MSNNKVLGIALGILAIILIILYIGIIIALVLSMNAILVLILVPKEPKKLFVSRPIGYGLTINPRNPLGLLIYTLLIILMFLITA